MISKERTDAPRVLLLGSGELGLGLTRELKRLGARVIAADRYAPAPALAAADEWRVLDMLDREAIVELIREVRPSVIIPEIEAVSTEALEAAEAGEVRIVPCAHAVAVCMDRCRLRRLAAEKGVPTSPFAFATIEEEAVKAADSIGYPCLVKPRMSSSGRGMSMARNADEARVAYRNAVSGGRGHDAAVIVEGLVDFDTEITLLTVRTPAGAFFCAPIGHEQHDGDYRFSWQPADSLSSAVLRKAHDVARMMTDAVGGYGIFGVEFFVKGNELFFNEMSPRPHDTGMVTLRTQPLSEFAIHARLALGLPVTEADVQLRQPGASAAIVAHGHGSEIAYSGIADAEAIPGVSVQLFGKPSVDGHRRMGVLLANSLDDARRVVSLISVLVGKDAPEAER